MARPAYPPFIAGASVSASLRKRARIRARPVTGLFEAVPVTHIDRFFEFFIFDFHSYLCSTHNQPSRHICRKARDQLNLPFVLRWSSLRIYH